MHAAKRLLTILALTTLALSLAACGDDGGGPVDDGGDTEADPCALCGADLCIDTPDGKACAVTGCAESGCPDGYSCELLEGAVEACVPAWGLLCDPCATDADCAAPGLTDTTCVEYGEAGSFCGAPCQFEPDCPEGFTCVAVVSTGRQVLNQCVPSPEDGGGAQFGACTCSARAVAAQLATVCGAKDASEACQGVRVCEAGGLTECSAPPKGEEICDGVDNDCDGLTDEKTCDDDNACTVDACEPDQGGCVFSAIADGLPCDDADACTGEDACLLGVCTGTPPPDCDDDLPCTIDSCDPLTGACVHTDLADGNPCNDGDPCTVQDACEGGWCYPGPPKFCDDGDPCTAGTCNSSNGQCSFAPMPDGSACDDGVPCTSGSACAGGMCLEGSTLDCDDGEACTQEHCDEGLDECIFEELTGACDDGSACTENDLCDAGVCTGDPVAGCFDGVPADVATCNEGTASTGHKLAALAELNYIRELSGLPPVPYDYDSDHQTQQSSLMTVANAELQHTPPETWACWSQDGYDGSSSSNLFIAYGYEATPEGVVDAFLIDTGVPSLGHRRWLLDPFLASISYGSAVGVPAVTDQWAYVHGSSIKVINETSADIAGLDLAFVAYPVGDYPAELFEKDWYHSFSVLADTTSSWGNGDVSYSQSDIRVTAPGDVELTVHSVAASNEGYGIPNHVQFIVDGMQDAVTYTVALTNVVVNGTPKSYEYTFTFE